jgi:two-component system chemotaxis sensor kinase CheA
VALKPAAAAGEGEETPALLFRSFAGTKRIVPLAAVERIEDVRAEAVQLSAGRLHVALGELILPLQGCGPEASGQPLRILRLSDGVSQIAYGFAEVIDIVSLGTNIRPAATEGEVRGVTLIDGEQVEVLDLFRLFEAELGPERDKHRRICVLPADDHWMETILGPVIESAGYQIVRAGTPEADMADIHLINADEVLAETPVASGRILKICSNPNEAAGDAVHRYDRSGLLQALGRPTATRKGKA